MSQTRLQTFVSVAPGLEPILLRELARIAPDAAFKRLPGGAEAFVDPVSMSRIVDTSRIAESVRIRIGHLTATSFADLELALEKVNWHAWIPDATHVSVRVTCHRSRLYHSDAVAERVERCLIRRGCHVGDEGATQRLYVLFDRDRATLSLDAAGYRLYQRGQRTHVAVASLRETLAAALVSCVPETASAIVDPFCGAGTLLIEAAHAWGTIHERPSDNEALQGATPAWHAWPALRSTYASTPRLRTVPREMRLYGGDLDTRALEACSHNLRDAVPGSERHLARQDAAESVANAPEGAWVVANPPYGHRLPPRELIQVFGRFGDALANSRADGCVVMNGFPEFVRATRLPWERMLGTNNRGIPVEFLRWARS
jgi:putative N6-adenine-specific DNA methylase